MGAVAPFAPPKARAASGRALAFILLCRYRGGLRSAQLGTSNP